jgi:hypothetical protein
MRFHKAIPVTADEAHSITSGRILGVSETVVLSQGDQYYDVRAMTESEIKAFAEDLAREQDAISQAAAARCN